MTLPDFRYHRPRLVGEATALLHELGPAARVMAGGTDLLPRLRAGRLHCAHVVALGGVEGLAHVRWDPAAGLAIGAAAVLADVASHPATARYPMLRQAIEHLATVQVRHKATVAGNLCNASPCADTAPPLVALGATVDIVGPTGARQVALEAFITGPGRNALQRGELVRGIWVPVPPEGMRTHFIKHSPRSVVDISAVNVAVAAVLDGATVTRIDIVLGTVGPTPVRAERAEAALRGRPATPDLIERAARLASAECAPITDFRATRDYKVRMARVLTRRALAAVTRQP